MFLIVNATAIRTVSVIGKTGDLYTVAFQDGPTRGYTRVRGSRLYRTEEEARAALEALQVKRQKWFGEILKKPEPQGPYTSREMERRYLLDHCGSPDP